MVGFAIYLANNTRPDISYAVRQLARFMSNPGAVHLTFTKQLLRYLNGTRTVGIIYSNKPDVRIPNERTERTPQYHIYSDSTWGTEDNRVSFHGYAVIWYEGVVLWMS